jgi:hypothetical protein
MPEALSWRPGALHFHAASAGRIRDVSAHDCAETATPLCQSAAVARKGNDEI